jgi:hypothetical protein
MKERTNWSKEPVCRPFQPQKPLILYNHTEAVGKTSPLVPNIFLISFLTKIPGQKKAQRPNALLKKE